MCFLPDISGLRGDERIEERMLKTATKKKERGGQKETQGIERGALQGERKGGKKNDGRYFGVGEREEKRKPWKKNSNNNNNKKLYLSFNFNLSTE